MKSLRDICNWYFSRGALPYWCILLLDCLTVYVCGLAGYYLQFGGDNIASDFWPVSLGLAVSLLFYILFFRVFHTYNGVMRFSSFVDLLNIVYSMLCSTAVLVAVACLCGKCGSLPFILPNVITLLVILVLGTSLMCLVRVIVKSLHDTLATSESASRSFIYGCMQGGVAIAKSIRNTSDGKFILSGFITPDHALKDSWLMGTRIYDDTDDIVQTMHSKGVSVLFVSPLQVENFNARTTLIDALIAAGIKIYMVPNAEEWDGRSNLSHTQLRTVEIEDLLPRQKIEIDMDAIGQMLRGQRVLITGAAGSIGSEMARQVAKFAPAELVLIDQAETPMHDVRRYMAANHKNLCCLTIVASITDQAHMEQIFSTHHPDYVFHAAAYKHVPMMEDNPAQAVRNNVYGTRVIADLSVKYGTRKFVMISTDKAVNPTNVMGCSKRICEIYCQALNAHQQTTQFVTTRFGNVLGSNGSVIPIFREQIRKGGPVMVTHPDIIRYFMLISEACRLVLEAGTMGHGGEIFVFDMGEPVKIVDLARRMIALSGAKNVEIQFSGLRDGEKLFEEVLNDAEQTKPTVHPKIKVAQVRQYPYDLALQNEIELYQLSEGFDDMAIVRKMKQIVPEYKSRNSKYESLDAEAK